MGKKICLFLYYVEQIDNKQWMEVWKVGGGRHDKKDNSSAMQIKSFCFLHPLIIDPIRG